jgi:hypothetical protein
MTDAKLLADELDAELHRCWTAHVNAPYDKRAFQALQAKVEKACTALRKQELYVQREAWIPVSERRPERNAAVLYWHKPFEGDISRGWVAQADEWRDEQHLAVATHWMPYPNVPASISHGD